MSLAAVLLGWQRCSSGGNDPARPGGGGAVASRGGAPCCGGGRRRSPGPNMGNPGPGWAWAGWDVAFKVLPGGGADDSAWIGTATWHACLV
jgi:hypothetical protein